MAQGHSNEDEDANLDDAASTTTPTSTIYDAEEGQ